MLLWVLILSLYGGAVVVFGRELRETLSARVLAVQGMIGAAFLGFLLFTSNPFLRLYPAPPEGTELNPLLQDPGLVFHPPMLYLGYVGFSMAFAFAVAALIEGRVDAGWARWVRPWVLAAWVCLTVGITMGSLWAYYELGWGGFWFWDPVENASLMPWLMGTALLHSSLVLERRGALISWTILLAILTFSLSLVGTFLVRSGVLTSVHAFAVDPQRGVYILGIISVTTASALGLYAWRAPAMRSGALFQPLSREGGITLNNLFLLTLTATVFLGTFYPVFMEVLHGDTISVGPPWYQMTFLPLSCPLLVLVAVGPLLNWKRDQWGAVAKRLRWPLAAGAAALVVAVVLMGLGKAFSAIGFAVGVWLIAGSLVPVARRWRKEGTFTASALRLVRATPRLTWAVALAHAGLGALAIGVSGVSAWSSSSVLMMVPGQSTTLAGQTITLQSVQPVTGGNFSAVEAHFAVGRGGSAYALTAQRRFYPSSQTQTTEAGIHSTLLGNTFIAIGEQRADGAITVRLWSHALIGWIWGGGLMMAGGGVLSLADRRYRLGAASRISAPATDPQTAPISA